MGLVGCKGALNPPLHPRGLFWPFEGGGPVIGLALCCFVVYSTRRFVLNLALCYFVLVFFSPFNIAITSLGEERANLSAFCTFVRFALSWFCLFPLSLGVWEGLRLVIVALPELFFYLFSALFGKRFPTLLAIYSFCGCLIVFVCLSL